MSRIRGHLIAIAAIFVAQLAFAASAQAESVADFYRGKTVRVVIGYGAGGNYDLYGRVATEFLSRHIPGNPTVIAVNMPGAGGFKAVDYLYRVAPQDGTYLGAVAQQLALTLLVDDKMGIDPRRFTYLGRLVSMVDVAVALPKSGLKSFDDTRKREVTVGAGQSTSTSAIYARALNAYAGSKFKIVTGYSGTAEIQLAAERGEVDVNGGESLPAIIVQYPEWLEGKAILLYQNGVKRYSMLPNTPTMTELATSEEGKRVMGVLAGTAEIGRSILTTPGVPP
jgi:tripartite-type tricarboxylate transporter receptor subunit TctC